MLSIEKFIAPVQPESTSGYARDWMMVRDPHIGTPARDVLKDFYKGLSASKTNMCRSKRGARLQAYRRVIAQHRQNQKAYTSIMRGL